MPASIFLNQLRSRITRSRLTNNLNVSIIGGGGQRNEQGNILTRIVSQVGRLIGAGFNWIVDRIKSINISFTGIFQGIVSGLTALANFNWNITYAQIDQQLEALNRRIWAQQGQTIGVTMGYVVCGIIPSAGILTFNQPLGLHLLYDAGEEALDEISSEFMSLVTIAIQNERTKFLYNTYKSARKWVKNYFKNPNSPQSNVARRLFGDNFNNIINSWGEEGSEPFTISEAIEEQIESIPNERTRIITEEAYESFIESCVDAGYVVAGGLDAWIMQQRALNAADQVNNPETVIEVTPNREVESETFLLAGDEQTLQDQLPIVYAHWQQISDRNLGTIVMDEVIQPTARRPDRLGLTARFRLTSEKGFNSSDSTRVTIKVDDVERLKLDFDRFIKALGGENGYTYGDYYCKVTLSNRDTIQMFASTPAAGLGRLRDLAALTPYQILHYNNPTAPSPEFAGNRRKPKVRLYPYSVTITYKSARLIERYQRNLNDDDQIYKEVTLPLWGKKPSDWNEQINDLFTIANPQSQN